MNKFSEDSGVGAEARQARSQSAASSQILIHFLPTTSLPLGWNSHLSLHILKCLIDVSPSLWQARDSLPHDIRARDKPEHRVVSMAIN